MRGSLRLIAIVAVGSVLMVSCSELRSQDVAVGIKEAPWTADPVAFEEAGTLNVTFTNTGSETHWPVVGSTAVSVEELTAHMEEFGTTNLIDELAGDEETARGLGVALAYGSSGHFHPGDDDEIALPPDARADVSVDGDLTTTHYLFTTGVPAGTTSTVSVSTGKNAIKGGESATSWVVLCMNEDHADNGEYAVFGLTTP